VRKLIAFLMALVIAPSAWAGPKSLYLTNVGHYIKHHKLELFGDFVMVGASAADVETSIRSQRTPGMCETNQFLPCHPSRAQLWGVKLPFLVGLGVTEHYIIKLADSPPRNATPLRTFEGLVIPSIWATVNGVTAKNNAKLIR
jgi:hypothetical protein